MNKSYLPILEPLLLPSVMPRRETFLTITLKSLQTVRSARYKVTETTVIMMVEGEIRTYPITEVTGMVYLDELVYPELPPGVSEVAKADGRGWVKSNLRALFSQVNRAALEEWDSTLVIYVEFNLIQKSLEVTMTGFWSSLPNFVRHKWLQCLWDLYTKLIVLYGVNLEYNRITLHPYNSSTKIIGYRSPWRSSVEYGPDCHYNLREWGHRRCL